MGGSWVFYKVTCERILKKCKIMAKLWLFQCKKEILYHCSHPGPETSELIQDQIKIGVTSTVSQAKLKGQKIWVPSNYFPKIENLTDFDGVFTIGSSMGHWWQNWLVLQNLVTSGATVANWNFKMDFSQPFEELEGWNSKLKPFYANQVGSLLNQTWPGAIFGHQEGGGVLLSLICMPIFSY